MPPVNWKAATKVYCRSFFDHFCPCLLCGKMSRSLLCAQCTVLLPSLQGPLCRCSLPMPGANNSQPPPLCGRCVRRPPPFAASHAPLIYSHPLDRLIQRYKHHGDLVCENALEQLLADMPLPWPDTDALCALPAHWQRCWWRGFDQSQRLASQLSRLWQRPLLPALLRQRATASQQGLKRTQRERNLRQAFRCVLPMAGLSITLIDDVMTTGSSARAASRTLLDAGAREVNVWTLARTLPPSRR
ncbi:ComF family protein [Alcanivorax profundi]|uniref:ComF family protein n=3 Tax=Alcanivorax TaxID=59753 RepID=A0A418XY51_9GAMM|nr:ComF family protein [Alcanivorax profundi]